MTARTAVLDKRLPRRAAARVRRLPTDVRHLPAYVTRFPGWVRRTAVALAPSPRVRRRLLVLAGVLALLGASYLFWFRNSSFVKVERVTVTGLSTRDASRLRAALTVTGRSMTTLHVDHDRLVRAVQGFPVVRGLEVRADFPHALRIEVVQHAPAALAIANGLRIPVAGDGTLLRGVPVEGRLPELHVSGSLPADRLRDRKALRLARVAGGAPAALTRRLDEVRESGDRGITVEVREGPTLIFGDATRVRAKWAAAARVLADPSARGASYVDLRLPDRPAAGGVEADTVTPVAPAARFGSTG